MQTVEVKVKNNQQSNMKNMSAKMMAKVRGWLPVDNGDAATATATRQRRHGNSDSKGVGYGCGSCDGSQGNGRRQWLR